MRPEAPARSKFAFWPCRAPAFPFRPYVESEPGTSPLLPATAPAIRPLGGVIGSPPHPLRRRHLVVRSPRPEGGARASGIWHLASGIWHPRSRSGRFRVRPEFVFPALRLAVFVDGCFWHACPRHATQPRNNAAFWRQKLAANRARDREVNRALRAAGWRVLRIWEHELVRRREALLLRRLRRAMGQPAG